MSAPWFGSVLAGGFVFDEALLGRARVVERLLATWTDGARLARRDDRWYLVGVTPRRVDTRTAPGAPLVWTEGRWLATSLSKDALAATPLDTVVELRGGAVEATEFRALTPVHPVTLISLPTPKVEVSTTLEPPPKRIATRAVAAAPTLESIFAPLVSALNAPPGPPDPPPVPPATPLRERLAGWWTRTFASAPATPGLFSRLASWLGAGSQPAAPALPPGPPQATGPNRPGLFSRLASWLGSGNQPAAAPALPPGPPQAAGPNRPGLFSRLASWIGSGNQPAAPALPPGPPQAAGPNRPGLFARLASWLGSGNQPAARALPPGPPQAPGPSQPGLFSRLASWFGAGNAPALPPPAIPPVVPPQAPAQANGATRRGLFARLVGGEGSARPSAERTGMRDFFARLFGEGDHAPTRGGPSRDEYLDDLRRRFSMGDLAEALRRAIPLNNQPAGQLGGAFSPIRRDSLSLLTPNGTSGPGIGLPGDQFEAMRKLYREAADQLIEKGQIEEAAFVLARLLNDAVAAVALLEKHGKLELAAQVATAQHLSEVERVRLWLLAGRKEEAIRIARASESFDTLVSALTPRAPHLATQLRAIWGDFLGQRQRFTEALVATAPLIVPPAEWDTWRDHAVAAGGAAAVTAVAADVGRFPTHLDSARAQLAEVLDADQHLTPVAANALLTLAPKTAGAIHRDLWRRLMRDASEGRVIDRDLVDRVLHQSQDGTLQIDAVKSAPPAPIATREALEVPAPAVTSLPVLDLAPLPKGRRALALGAAGLKVVSATGETLRHHLVKADALVVGPPGATVLVLSLDGALTRVWRFDPFTFALTSWFQGSIDAFARRSDGLCWAVGMEESLVLLDPGTPSSGATEWWRVPRFSARAIDAVGSRVIALGSELALNESRRMVFDVAAQKLDRRLDADDDAYLRGAQLLAWTLKPRLDGRTELTVRALTKTGSTVKPSVLLSTGTWATLALEEGLVLWRAIEGNTEVRFVGWSDAELRAKTEPRLLARLWGTRRVTVREVERGRLAMLDEHGRVTELSV